MSEQLTEAQPPQLSAEQLKDIAWRVPHSCNSPRLLPRGIVSRRTAGASEDVSDLCQSQGVISLDICDWQSDCPFPYRDAEILIHPIRALLYSARMLHHPASHRVLGYSGISASHTVGKRSSSSAISKRSPLIHRIIATISLYLYLIKKSGGAGILGPMSRGAVE